MKIFVSTTDFVAAINLTHFKLSEMGIRCSVIKWLKEQYSVTAHAPNFDFWTGCREIINRCEESKRTLKNPFTSRFAEFGTTLKLLRITDQ